ncbi:6510_t:CDS:2, partial [Gigaspora margarita]
MGDKENIAYEGSVSSLNMEQEQEQNIDTANNKKYGRTFWKNCENSDVIDSNIPEEDPNQNLGTNLINPENKLPEVRQWSSLFIKLKSDKLTYSNFAPRDKIHTKNDNALIFNIQSLENISINDIEFRLQVIMQTQVQNQTKIMESVTYRARIENSEISEGASNEEISDNRLDENIHGEENLLYTPESEKEKVVNAENAESRKEIEAEKVAQEYKKGDKIEIVVDTHVASKLITDEDRFVQVINKKNKKKNSSTMMDKRLSLYDKDRIIKKSRASL